MKFIHSILFVLVLLSISCKKETTTADNTIPPAPDSGMYITTQFSESQVVVTRNIAYSTRTNIDMKQYTSDSTKGTDTLSATLKLRLDIAVPPNATSSAKQPVIVYIHGGNFLAGDKEDMEEEAMTYARAGYVAVSINYRLTADNESNSVLRIQAISNATDDAMNAIRYLKANANLYHIDTNRIATIGSSAGGGISLINAIEYDELVGVVSDYPGYSSKVAGAISTGATLVEPGIDPNAFLHFDNFDTPILLFHANPEDGYRHTTWIDNVIPTQALVNNSGNECTIVPQPDMTHTVNLSVGGTYWTDLKNFLWKKLKLYDL